MQGLPVNEQKPSSALPLLVLRVESLLTQEQQMKMMPALEELAAKLNAVSAVEQPGATIRLEANPKALLDSSLALTESVSQLVDSINLQTKTMQELIEALYEGGDEDEGDEDPYATLDGR